MARTRGKSGKSGLRFFVGFVLGVLVAVAGVLAYFKFHVQPVPVVHPQVAFEKKVIPPPARAQVDHDHGVKMAPFAISEDVFEAGAHVYRKQCASCHGIPAHDAVIVKSRSAAALQLWKGRSRENIVGVSGEKAGEIYGKVANGIPQAGMPAYRHLLSDTQMWQVSLLLKNADQQLPDPVLAILNGAK